MTNAQRIESASTALETVDEKIVGDLLANLMHYCEANGIDFEAELNTAKMHYQAERS